MRWTIRCPDWTSHHPYADREEAQFIADWMNSTGLCQHNHEVVPEETSEADALPGL